MAPVCEWVPARAWRSAISPQTAPWSATGAPVPGERGGDLGDLLAAEGGIDGFAGGERLRVGVPAAVLDAADGEVEERLGRHEEGGVDDAVLLATGDLV